MNGTEWTLIKAGKHCQWEILVADEYSIEESTHVVFDKVNRILTVEVVDGVTIGLFDAKGKELSEERVNLTNKASFLMKKCPAGTYLLRITKAKQKHEVKIKLGAPIN